MPDDHQTQPRTRLAVEPPQRSLTAQVQYAELRALLGIVERVEAPVLDAEGRYELLGVLGSGAAGVVYRARDRVLNRMVALKVLRPSRTRESDREARVMREAQILAKLDAPNILVIYDVDHACDGELFLAMQYVEGSNLRAWQAGRALSQVLPVYLAAGLGLAAAHDHGVVHRDFKPENVLIGDGAPPTVFVGDFGLATEASVGTEGGRFGTPAYMAPEQRHGLPATEASDQFAFCIALWEACVGARPWLEAANINVPLVRPPELPRWLYRALRVGLELEPGARHPSMLELLRQLDAGTKHRRRRRLTGLAGLALVASAGVGYGLGARPLDCAELGRREAAEDQHRIAEVAAHLERIAISPEALSTTIEAMTDNIQARRAMAVGLCEQRRGGADSVILDRREACVARWRARTRAQAEAMLELATHHSWAAYDHVLPLVAQARVCAAIDVARPIEASVQMLLDRSEAASLRLDYDTAETRALEALARAERMPASCSAAGSLSRERGHALAQLGHVRSRAGRPGEAAEAYDAALGHARACTDEWLETEVLLELSQVLASEFEQVEHAETLVQIVVGALERAGEPDLSVRRAELHEARGFIAFARGDHDAAIELYRKGLEALGPSAVNPLRAARLHNHIGAALYEAGDLTSAIQSYRQARVEITEHLGAGDPRAEHYLRSVQLNEGLAAVAREEFDQARAQLEPLFDAPEPLIRTKAMAMVLRTSLGAVTQPDELALARRLVATLRATPQLEPRARMEGLNLAGNALVGAEDPAGLALLHEALDLCETHFPNEACRALGHASLATAYWNLDLLDECEEQLRRARKLTSPIPARVELALRGLEAEFEP